MSLSKSFARLIGNGLKELLLKDKLIADDVFDGFVKSEVPDYDSLTAHVKNIMKKTFYAGMITTFNHSQPLVESILVGKNAHILGKQKSDGGRFVVMQVETEIEAKKTSADFDIYQKANYEYQTLFEETKVFSRKNMTVSKRASKKSDNVVNFEHAPPKTQQ